MPRSKDPLSKSQLIRDYRSNNPKATAREIQEGLKKDGQEVALQLIYNVASTSKKRRKGRKPVNGQTNGVSSGKSQRGGKAMNGQSNGVTKSDSISVESLLEAKQFVTSLGSMEAAKRALDTLAKLS